MQPAYRMNDLRALHAFLFGLRPVDAQRGSRGCSINRQRLSVTHQADIAAALTSGYKIAAATTRSEWARQRARLCAFEREPDCSAIGRRVDTTCMPELCAAASPHN